MVLVEEARGRSSCASYVYSLYPGKLLSNVLFWQLLWGPDGVEFREFGVFLNVLYPVANFHTMWPVEYFLLSNSFTEAAFCKIPKISDMLMTNLLGYPNIAGCSRFFFT